MDPFSGRRRARRQNRTAYISGQTLTMIPELPDLYAAVQSTFIFNAYDQILHFTRRGINLISKEEPDALRLKIAAEDLQYRCLPLVHDLAQMPEVPRNWLDEVADCIVNIRDLLKEAMAG